MRPRWWNVSARLDSFGVVAVLDALDSPESVALNSPRRAFVALEAVEDTEIGDSLSPYFDSFGVADPA